MKREPLPRTSWAITLAATLTVTSCNPPAAPTPTVPASEASLPAIAYPELGSLDPDVQRHLAEVGATLQALEERPDATRSTSSTASIYGEAGITYLAYDFNDAAVACFAAAASLAPDQHAWRYYLAHARSDSGDAVGALATFREALALAPRHFPTLLHLARLEVSQQQLDAAQAHFEEAAAIDPKSAAPRIGLGRIALLRRDYEAARDHLEAGLRQAPEATSACYSLGLAYRGLGEPETAAKWMKRQGEARASFPDELLSAADQRVRGQRLHHDRGLRYFRAGDWRAATVHFRAAVAAGPADARTRMNLASALARGGAQQEAEQEFRHSLRLDPNNATAQFTYGTFLAQTGRDEQAVGHYRTSLQLDPENPDCHFNLANALRRLHRFEPATQHYRETLEREPLNATARLALALTHLRLGAIDAAYALLDESHAALPEDPRIANALARILAAAPETHAHLRNGPRAVALAAHARSRQNSVSHIETHAMALAEIGDFVGAQQLLADAIQAVRKSNTREPLRDLHAMRTAFAAGRPWRTPWRMDHPLLTP